MMAVKVLCFANMYTRLYNVCVRVCEMNRAEGYWDLHRAICCARNGDDPGYPGAAAALSHLINARYDVPCKYMRRV